MNKSENPSVVEKDLVVVMDYKLFVDGELADTSEEDGPISFLQGHENILPGLEKELYGLSVGDSKKVIVSPEEGYGEIDEEAFMEIPRSEIPDDIPVELGVEIEMESDDGDLMEAAIVEIGKDYVKLDFNHPLAGKELTFEITIREIRKPTSEELDHGHVHEN